LRAPAVAAAALLALVASTGCAYFNTLYNARQKYDEAQAQKRAADPDREEISKSEERLYTESFEKAAKVVKYYPDSKYVDDALLLMGKASFEKGDYSTALRKFDEILTFFPGSKLRAEALVMKGRTLAATRDYEGAVTALLAAEAIDRKELRDEVLYFLGVVREGKDETETAESRYAQVVEKHDGSEWFAEAGLRAGDLARERGDPAAAVAFYERVRKGGETSDDRFRGGVKKGEALLEMGERERARETFEDVAKRTLNLDDRGHAMLLHARAGMGAGNDEAAVEELLEVIRSFERREAAADAQLEIAQWHDRNGRLEEALAVYEQVKDQGTGHPAWQKASERRTEIQRVLDLRAAVTEEDDAERNENRFLLAEQLLEKIGDVDGALREYASLAADADGTEWGARALFAEAWVQQHRRGDQAAADSLLFRLANHYAGTEVDAFARRKLGYPVWKVEIVEPPPVQFIRPEGGDAAPDVVLERVEPAPVAQPLPPGKSQVKVWVRVQVADDGTAADASVSRSAGDGLAAFDEAAVAAARASRYLAPDAGGPGFQVMEYTFPPEPAAGDGEPTAAERDATLDARDAAASAAGAAPGAPADSAAAVQAPADSAAAPSTPLDRSRGPVLRDRGGSGGRDD
jgi:TonB family protein